MSWDKGDQQFVAATIRGVAAKVGGQAELARQMGLNSRANINAWIKKGYIPVDNHAKFIDLAKPEYSLRPEMLHPDARKVTDITSSLS